jgi:O-antigen ligase/tetratricopeptide (TPR) repeat protein
MAKNYKAKEPVQIAKSPAAAVNQSFRYTIENIAPLVACLLYFAIHFIPDMGGYDAMGIQWVYMVALDFVVTAFILIRKNEYGIATARVLGNTFSKLYLAFFVLAGVSIITAINPVEGWVCYVRIIATIVAYFNVSILLHDRNHLFKIIAQLLGLILLVEAYQTITQFMSGLDNTNLTELIMSLKGTAGNKNIFAAGLVVKIPFVLYAIHASSKLWSKLLNVAILILASLAIFIVNARAAYLSLLFILLMYLAFCVITYLKERQLEKALSRVGFVLVPVIIAFFVSMILLTNAGKLQDDKEIQNFGSVTDRLASVAKTDDESNQVRFRLWAHAIDYTMKHPFIGCGIGNWKIASVPYQRTITNDLYVPIHAHNDFLEMFAELGIPGGLVYLAMFVCLLVFTIKTLFSNAEEDTKLASVFTLMAFAGYAIDTLFNFPTERPVSQMFFIIISALNVGAFMKGREETGETKEPGKNSAIAKPVFGLLAVLLLIPAGYITYLNYQSLIIQRTVLGDINNEPLKLDWKVVVPSFPSIPNLTATAQPIDAIKGRYLYEVGKYPEALVLLEKGRKANPVIGSSELVAFYIRPKAKTYFQTLIAVLAQLKDTVNIKKAFAEYDRYRHHAYGWNLYMMGMLTSLGKGTPELLKMTDSALHMFPNQPEVKDLEVRRQEILRLMAINTAASSGKTIDLAAAQKYYVAGIAAFGTGNAQKDNLAKAAELFIKSAEINPYDYIIYENAAMCYFNMQNYKNALVYFNKALALKTSTNGKSEFFKGVSLMNLGKNEEGCETMKISKAKGYKEKEAEMNNILKTRCGVQ